MVMSVLGVVITFFVVLVLVLTGNGYYLFNKFKDYIADIASKTPIQILIDVVKILPNKNLVYIGLQIIIVIALFIFGLIGATKKKKRPKLTKTPFSQKKFENEAQTDLDILYAALLKKKELSTEVIQEMFNIDKEIVFDWCRTLEAADLAVLEYPSFQKPVLRLPEEPKEEENKVPKKKKIKHKKKEKAKHKKHSRKKYESKLTTTKRTSKKVKNDRKKIKKNAKRRTPEHKKQNKVKKKLAKRAPKPKTIPKKNKQKKKVKPVKTRALKKVRKENKVHTKNSKPKKYARKKKRQ